MVFEYLLLVIFILVIVILTLLIPFFSNMVVYQENYQEKVSTYECGFEPLESHLAPFEVRYYLLALSFLIFDLEIMFLLPWLVVLPHLLYQGVLSMVIFLFFLVIGFYYE